MFAPCPMVSVVVDACTVRIVLANPYCVGQCALTAWFCLTVNAGDITLRFYQSLFPLD